MTLTKSDLAKRRRHELKGCTQSRSGLFDNRCAFCKGVDTQLQSHTVVFGTAPAATWTTYDRTFLKSLRIAAD